MRKVKDKVEAVYKPHDVVCPHLTIEEGEASCAVHEEPEYQNSPCHTYGNPDLDIDFLFKKGKPCPVGALLRKEKKNVLTEERPDISELEFCCLWKELGIND